MHDLHARPVARMDPTEIRKRFEELSVWKRGDQRAPHKPLLVLMTLGQAAAGGSRLASYEEIDRGLRPLLEEFGPQLGSYHTEYPFWYLQNDGVWEVNYAETARVREGKATQPPKSELLRVGAAGGLIPDVFNAVTSDSKLLKDIVRSILDAHFPDSIHEDILTAVGLSLDTLTTEPSKRDPQFRSIVLLAYEFKCAVCSFDARLGSSLVGVEAAHIKWHQAGGPAAIENGLALCSLHHKLFDRGAFTLSTEQQIEVSQHMTGGDSTSRWMTSFHGQPVRIPDDPSQRPHSDYVEWHRAEVFHGPARYRE